MIPFPRIPAPSAASHGEATGRSSHHKFSSVTSRHISRRPAAIGALLIALPAWYVAGFEYFYKYDTALALNFFTSGLLCGATVYLSVRLFPNRITALFFSLILALGYSWKACIWDMLSNGHLLRLEALIDQAFSHWIGNRSLMADSLWWTSLVQAFSALTLVLFALIVKRPGASKLPSEKWTRGTTAFRSVTVLLYTAVILSIISGAAEYMLGIGVAGIDAAQLPYRIAGIVLYLRILIVPGLLYIALDISDSEKNSKKVALIFSIIFFHALSQSLLTTGRGILPILMLPALLYTYLRGNIPRRLIYTWAMIVLVMTLTVFFWLLQIREERFNGGRLQQIDENNTITEETIHFLVDVPAAILLRITGFDALEACVEYGKMPYEFDYKVFILNKDPENVIARRYTHEVMNFPGENHMFAPSALGTCLLIGGFTWGIGLVALWLLLWLILEHIVLNSRLKLKFPLMMALFAEFLISTMEGNLDNIWFPILLWLAAIATCEIIMRFVFLQEQRL